MHIADVTCPSCYQVFSAPCPHFDELPSDVDYDCEICCRPLRIYFDHSDGDVQATAYGLGDSGPYG
jgi:hypothetical protein